jgi:hypothetical protein
LNPPAPPAQHLLLLLGRQERSQRPGQETPLETKNRAGGIGGPQTKTLEETKLHKTEFWIFDCFFEREERQREERERFVRGEADGGKGKASAAAPEETRRRRRQG